MSAKPAEKHPVLKSKFSFNFCATIFVIRISNIIFSKLKILPAF